MSSVAISAERNGNQVSGRIEDPAAAPIAQASITLISLDQVFQTRSAADGSFLLENLKLGVYDLEITASGFTKKTVHVTLAERNAPQTFRIVLWVGNLPDMEECGRDVSIRYQELDSAGAIVSGTLRDFFSHKLIANAELQIVNETDRRSPVVVHSDPAGRFIVEHLAPDYYNIRISRKNYEQDQLKHVAVPRENKVVIDWTLKRHDQIAICQ